MNDIDTRNAIKAALKAFTITPIAEAALSLLKSLGYHSDKRIVLHPNTSENFCETFVKDKPFNLTKALTDKWQSVDLLFQLTDDEITSQAGLTFGG